jgi:hypothetical protein
MASDPVAALAQRQDGLVLRAQVLGLGMTEGTVRRRIEAGGRWQVVLPGVYATFTGPLAQSQRLRAALLHGGDQAMLCGLTAAELHGLRYLPQNDGSVHVLVPENTKVRSVAFVRVHRTTRHPRAWRRAGFPLTPPAQAAIEVARPLRNLRDVRAVLCETVQRGLATPDELAAELRDGPSAGSALPRRALADIVAGCRSAPECEVRDVVRASAVLPEPRWNQPLPGANDRWLTPDACWPEAQLIVEIDSIEWHRFGDRPEATERRRARLAALGWRVLPVSPRRLREEPTLVRNEIEAAFLSGRRSAG